MRRRPNHQELRRLCERRTRARLQRCPCRAGFAVHRPIAGCVGIAPIGHADTRFMRAHKRASSCPIRSVRSGSTTWRSRPSARAPDSSGRCDRYRARCGRLNPRTSLGVFEAGALEQRRSLLIVAHEQFSIDQHRQALSKRQTSGGCSPIRRLRRLGSELAAPLPTLCVLQC